MLPPKVAAWRAAKAAAARGAEQCADEPARQEIDNDYQRPADAMFQLAKSVADVHEHEAVLRSTRCIHDAQVMMSAEAQAVGGQAAARGDACDRKPKDELVLETDEQFE